jgi:ubiquinone/menaquinone biosynthesis C-methylase UbiE
MGALRSWMSHFRRLVGGRPNWEAKSEFAYYCVDDRVVKLHAARQTEFAREAFVSGLRVVRALGLLDASRVGGGRVLDFGAGECMLAEAIAFSCGAGEVWATDAVPKQIWAAAERYPTASNLRFLIADACDLPFDDEQFDFAVANLVLHHIQPLESVLAEAFRVLRPGGTLAAFEPNPVLGSLVHSKTSDNEAPVARRAIVRALERVGFVEATTEYWWSRFETSKLGVLSPGYRIHATKPGASKLPSEPVALRRPLDATRIEGLRIDTGCAFAQMAGEQIDEILRVKAAG